MTLDHTCSRTIYGIEMSEPAIRNRLHYDTPEASLIDIGADSGGIFPQPLANASVCIMIEAVHTVRAHSLVDGVAVPTLPDCSSTIVDGIEPARIPALEEQVVCYVIHPVLRQCRKQY